MGSLWEKLMGTYGLVPKIRCSANLHGTKTIVTAKAAIFLKEIVFEFMLSKDAVSFFTYQNCTLLNSTVFTSVLHKKAYIFNLKRTHSLWYFKVFAEALRGFRKILSGRGLFWKIT